MKFLVDAQLPRRLSLWLQEQGYDSRHTLDLPEGNRTTDARICAIADTETRVVVTKDADFVYSFEIKGTPARLLLISAGNLSNTELLTLWHKHLDKIVRAFESASFVELAPTRLISRE
ncbi:DUF5615 family PIN-like protein [Microbulbifer sp.]|uniref:DUF5615 family PIN-like protein n=1 Tax=Microbulbifer sp. TaxID=1908541 RepID=UPI003F2D3299